MTDIRIIVDDHLKTNAENVLTELDITMSQAVRMFLKQIVKNKKLPFNPFEEDFNEETKDAIKRSKNKKNLITHKSKKAMFKEWDEI